MSVKDICEKEKGANKVACMKFFEASTGEEGVAQMIAALTKKKTSKKKKSKAQMALGINK
jgi:hypothetical protein